MRLSQSSRSLITADGSRSRPMTSSLTELPNLPGIRRDLSASNPRLYKEFMASTRGSEELGDTGFDAGQDSLMSYFEDPENRAYLSQALSPYPSQGNAYNDVGGRYSMRSQQSDRLSKSRSLPYCSLDSAPAFVKSKKECCRFLAFFKEAPLPDEIVKATTKLSRKVEITVHIDDNSIEINEPKVSNCGLMQGRVLRRHQIMKRVGNAKADPTMIYTLSDFFSGAQLEIYNRVYTVIDCDNYTRRKMDTEGIPFGRRLPLPSDTYVPTQNRGASRQSANKAKNASKKEANQGFYEHGKKVLRFYGLWDDTTALYGDKIRVRMHYFLADDAIEVLPIHDRNSGRDRLPKYLKKTKIPLGADRDAISQASNTILQDGEPIPTYHWKDIFIGLTIQVATFSIEILDADEFTRAFYEMKNMPLGEPIVMEVSKYEIKERPPMSTDGLIGEIVEKDGIKFNLFQGVTLRFLAKICDPKPEDVQRRFIIQVHLEDDTILIREPPIRNSGIKGGLFLARGKVSAERGGRNVEPTDLYLGATVSILSFKFEIYDADEASLKYMENHDFMWHQCHIPSIIDKLKKVAVVLKRIFLTTRNLSDKPVNAEELFQILIQANAGLCKQEAFVLFRSIDVATGKTGKIQLNTLLRVVM